MEEPLRQAWLGDTAAVPVRDRASLSLVRERIRGAGAHIGLGVPDVERAALIGSELGANQLDHAALGEVAIRAVVRGGLQGLEVVAADHGPGLADPERALRGDPSSERGGGVSAVFRLADELDVDVRLRQGTCIRARIFAEAPPRRSEVGIVGRPLHRERVNGDQALCARAEGTLTAAVVDGVGHGVHAFEASATAVLAAARHADLEPVELLRECHRHLVDGRGAAMGVARIDLASGDLQYACVGDIGARIVRLGQESSLPNTPGLLGQREGSARRVRTETERMAPGDSLVLFTDGLKGRWSLADKPLVQRKHPVLMAHSLLEDFARGNDDVLVLVVR